MSKFKKYIPFFSIAVLYIVLFNILAFVLATSYKTNFWCGYIFVTLSWISLVANIVEMANEMKTDENAIFLNSPGIFITGIHLIIQTVLSALIMALNFVSVKLWACLQIVVLFIYFALIASLKIYKGKNKH